MPTSILATKLYVPPPRSARVLRSRLFDRLNEGLQRKLTLISAPAGFGKTTLISEWVAGNGRPAAWLSLDEADGDPTRFLAYLVAALQTVAAEMGEGVLSVLNSPQPPPTESILTTLLNELALIPQPFVLVLDDYHALDSSAVDQALAFLLEHMPPRMHLVITTREDPSLPLARLRARGQLTELRASDLRFTASEAADFLNQVMGLDLAPADIAALEEHTEGWVAGLQLAALSVQGRPDATEFIRAFAGDHRYIVDYLVEEVLQRQPAPVRSFLLQTSILSELNGPLCDAVTGQEGSQARLEALERGNLFVVPLDDKRQTYRFHHLFAEVLLAHLRAEQPAQLPTLHRRASEWYEQQGSAAETIRHALAAGDFARAANMVELAVPAVSRNRQEATLIGWLRAIPDDVMRCRPVLSVHYAGALMQTGEFEGVESRLRDAERWLETAADRSGRPETAAEMVVVDREEFRRLPGWIANYRAASALFRGDLHATAHNARRARDLLSEEDHLGRGAAAALLGLAQWASGDLKQAHRSYVEGMAQVQRAGHISDALGCSLALADICLAQGRLHAAQSIFARGLQMATEQGASVLRGTADMLVGLAELHRERNDLHAATEHLLKCKELGEHTGLPQNPYRWRVAMARVRQAQGDAEGALLLLDEAERLYVGDFSPNVRPVAATRAQLWSAQGRWRDALGWAREQGLSVEDDLSYLHEFEHITLARALLARSRSQGGDGSLPEAIGLLERLLCAAEAGERTGSVIEILIMLALAHQMQGDLTAALASLERALRLAEPEGYVRLFVDEGPPMALLLEAAARGITPGYTGILLAALGGEQAGSAGEAPLPPASPAQPLVEPLSQRELEVVRLFQTELSGPEIAQQLVVALSTVRTHTKSIYSKLNVNSRRAAVRRAAELGLI